MVGHLYTEQGMYATIVFERAKAPSHFLLGKGHPYKEIVNNLLKQLKDTKAMTRGQIDNRLRCLREVSGLYLLG